MPGEREVKPLVEPTLPKSKVNATEPCGCHLQVIYGVTGCWRFGLSQFDSLLKKNHGEGDGYRGQYFTATLCSVPRYPKDNQFGYNYKCDHEELTKRGFIILGIQPGAHIDLYGEYEMVLYGKGFTLPEQEKKV